MPDNPTVLAAVRYRPGAAARGPSTTQQRQWLDRPRASYGSQNSPRRHAPDPRRRKFDERFGRHAAREAAGRLRPASCAARRGCVQRRRGQATGALRVGSRFGDGGSDQKRATPASACPPACARPTPAGMRERFGRHAREAACCWRMAFVRGQTRALSAAVRASCRSAGSVSARGAGTGRRRQAARRASRAPGSGQRQSAPRRSLRREWRSPRAVAGRRKSLIEDAPCSHGAIYYTVV